MHADKLNMLKMRVEKLRLRHEKLLRKPNTALSLSVVSLSAVLGFLPVLVAGWVASAAVPVGRKKSILSDGICSSVPEELQLEDEKNKVEKLNSHLAKALNPEPPKPGLKNKRSISTCHIFNSQTFTFERFCVPVQCHVPGTLMRIALMRHLFSQQHAIKGYPGIKPPCLVHKLF